MLHALFSLLGYLDDQHGELLEICLNYHGFWELPNLIEYTTIGNGTILKDMYTTSGNGILLKDLDYLVNITQLSSHSTTLLLEMVQYLRQVHY